MENKQMDIRHQRTDDKSAQKTNNGYKNQSRNQRAQKKQTDKNPGKWEGQDMNHPTKDKLFNPNHNRDTESAGVIDEDRGPYQDAEIDHPSLKRSFAESVDIENSSIDSPKKRNQAPQSKFS